MSEPAVQLRGVSEATDEMRGIARQALEWVRVSEERVARAEARAEQVHAEVKQRAMETLRKIGEEGRTRVAAEREKRVAAENRAEQAEDARRRAEKAFEQLRRSDQADRDAAAAEMLAFKERTEQKLAETVKRLDAESERQAKQAADAVRADADARVAAAEQRAAEAEARAEESQALAVRLEAEIDERVMQGTEEVRRQAEDRVRDLIAKFEGEAREAARARAKDQLEAESERIRRQAEQREERARQTADEEIKASTNRARREALAAAEQTAPSWGEHHETPPPSPISGYRTF
jgi:colicin import membrane protein